MKSPNVTHCYSPKAFSLGVVVALTPASAVMAFVVTVAVEGRTVVDVEPRFRWVLVLASRILTAKKARPASGELALRRVPKVKIVAPSRQTAKTASIVRGKRALNAVSCLPSGELVVGMTMRSFPPAIAVLPVAPLRAETLGSVGIISKRGRVVTRAPLHVRQYFGALRLEVVGAMHAPT